jgi:hypothetical protein
MGLMFAAINMASVKCAALLVEASAEEEARAKATAAQGRAALIQQKDAKLGKWEKQRLKKSGATKVVKNLRGK